MNRFVLVPGFVALAGFLVFCSIGPSVAPAFSPSMSSPLTTDQASTLILDGWPVDQGFFDYGSRGEPDQYFFGRHGQIAGTGNDGGFLTTFDIMCKFRIKNDPKLGNKRFPIHINRYSGLVRIFADQQWQSYDDWRENNLPIYYEAAGLPIPKSKSW